MVKKSIALMLSVLMLVTIAVFASPAQAAAPQINWPANIEIIVPFAPGGDTDFNARLIAEELGNHLPPNFVVVNVTGAGGSIGARQAMESAADGSRAFVSHSAFVVNQVIGTVDFGFEAFEMAGIIGMSPGMLLLVRPELGINTLAELFEYSKANPGKLLYGVETNAVNFAVANLLVEYGLDVTLVDAGPSSERVTMLLGGHVDMVPIVYGLVQDYIAEGLFVPIGIDGPSDLEVSTGLVQSFRNQGFDITIPFLYFMAFPAGTDPNLVAAVTEVIERIVLTNDEYRAAIARFFQTPTFYGPEESLAMFAEVYEILSKVEF